MSENWVRVRVRVRVRARVDVVGELVDDDAG